MKFENYEIIKDENGFKFTKDDIMKVEKESKCSQCGCKTNFIDVDSETYVCSDECQRQLCEEFNQLVKSLLNREGE